MIVILLLFVGGCVALIGASLVLALRGAANALTVGLLVGGVVGLVLAVALFILVGLY